MFPLLFLLFVFNQLFSVKYFVALLGYINKMYYFIIIYVHYRH